MFAWQSHLYLFFTRTPSSNRGYRENSCTFQFYRLVSKNVGRIVYGLVVLTTDILVCVTDSYTRFNRDYFFLFTIPYIVQLSRKDWDMPQSFGRGYSLHVSLAMKFLLVAKMVSIIIKWTPVRLQGILPNTYHKNSRKPVLNLGWTRSSSLLRVF